MRTALSSAAIILLFAGCGRRVEIAAPELPVEITRVAVLLFDDGGALLGASGILARAAADRAISATLDRVRNEGIARVELIGYSEVAFEKAPPPADPARLSDPLRLAGSADAVLPAPSWDAVGPVVGGRAQLAAGTFAHELTADWLPACPQLFEHPESLSLDIDCASARCDVRIRQDGCALILPTAPCLLGSISGAIDARGAITFTSPGRFEKCETIAAREDGVFSFRCTDPLLAACRFDIFPPHAPRFELTRRRVVAPSGPAPMEGNQNHVTGYLPGLVRLGSSIAVATTPVYRGLACAADEPEGRMLFLDPETLRTTATATLPPCFHHPISDPTGASFWAAFGTSTRAVGRFDAQGKLLRSIALSALPVEGHPEVTAIALLPPPLAVTLYGSHGGGISDPVGYVVVFDSGTLAVAGVLPIRSVNGSTQILALAQSGPNLFGAVENDSSQVVMVGTTGAMEGDILQIPNLTFVGGHHFSFASYHAPSGRLLISAEGAGHILSIDHTENVVLRVKPFESSAEPYATMTWPAEPARMLAGMTDWAGSEEASVALFDPLETRFLPGATVVGEGRVGGMIADTSGRAWITLPKTGEVVRVERKP